MRPTTLLSFLGAGVCALASTASAQTRHAPADIRSLGTPCDLFRVDRSESKSTQCLSCHDGTIGPASAFRMTDSAQTNADHPVAMDYDSISWNRANNLRPQHELPPAIVLVDGKMECTTCHAAGGEGGARTALPLAGSQLCFACHAM